MVVVAKFGGSSLSCATQFAKVKNIIKDDSKRKIVVVSALGKRDKDDTKITDLLYILHAHLMYGANINEVWNLIYERFIGVKNELNISYDISIDLNEIHDNLSKNISIDYLVSRGEYLTAKLMSSYLGYKFVDAADLLIYSNDGLLDEIKTSEALREHMDMQGIVVPGFYGSYYDGNIKLLSRGGSDVTGAILAKAINASLYENWTDVSGVMMADPRIVDNPKIIDEITYHELRELSYMGASVLHEETIFPVQDLNIPINLKNTNAPLDKGTVIKNECNTNNAITGITGKKGFVGYNIYKKHLSNEVGFMRKVLLVFESRGVNVEHVPTGIDSISVIVSVEQSKNISNEIISEINKVVNPDNIELTDEMALIAIVGRNMMNKIGLCGKAFYALGKNDINVKMIAQGPDEFDIIIGVSNLDYAKTIRSLYNELVD